jgi:thiosulfate/3-mercaptopyruvate sulfurtransferase
MWVLPEEAVMKKVVGSLVFGFTLLIVLVGPAAADLSDYFVSTEWLADTSDNVTIVDVRIGPKYLLGHIDEAIHIDKAKFLKKREGVKSLVPDAREFESLLDRYGIGKDTVVVAYAEHTNPYSARFVWMMRFHGHEKSYVLDGGYEKWASEKRPVALLPTKVTPKKGYRVTSSENIRASADYIYTRLHNPSVVIWDTRRPGEYNGTEVRADRGGHIPGSVHLNWVDLQKDVNGIKVVKSEDEIRELLASKGIVPENEIVAHCQTGIRSSYATLVLKGLGYENAKNYDGSWIEWANTASLPIMVPGKLAQTESITE